MAKYDDVKGQPDSYLQYLEAPSETELGQLQVLAEAQRAAEQRVRDAEKALEAAQKSLKDLAENKIPELMDRFQLKEFKTASGLEIEVHETIRANIPKEQERDAFAWLMKNGHGGLIDRLLSVKLRKGEEEKAKQIHELLDPLFDVNEKVGVHAQTLSAFVRERLREGKEVPEELFGVHRQRAAKVLVP